LTILIFDDGIINFHNVTQAISARLTDERELEPK
jgi:hypothetical protein